MRGKKGTLFPFLRYGACWLAVQQAGLPQAAYTHTNDLDEISLAWPSRCGRSMNVDVVEEISLFWSISLYIWETVQDKKIFTMED